MMARLADWRMRFLPARAEFSLLAALCYVIALYGLWRGLLLDWRVPVVAAAASGAVVLAWFGGTRICLPLYFATSFGEVIRVPGVPVSINQLMAALFFLSACCDFIRHRIMIPMNRAFLLFLLTAAFNLWTTLAHRPVVADYPIQAIFYLVPVVAISCLFWRKGWIETILHAFLLLSIFLYILPGIIEFFLHIDIMLTRIIPRPFRINGLSKDSILYAYNTLWLLPFAITLFAGARDPSAKVYYFLLSMCLAFCCLLTLNRQTPVIMMVMLFVQLFLMRYAKRLVLLGVGCAIALVSSPLFLSEVVERFSEATNPMMDYSVLVRRDKIRIAVAMWKANPWVGVGHEHYQHLWRDYIPRKHIKLVDGDDDKPHRIDSGYVQILTEFGIVGMLLFLLLTAAAALLFLNVYRRSRLLDSPHLTNLLAAVGAMFVQFYIANLVSDAFIRLQTYYIFAFLFAMSIRVERELREQEEAAERIPS